MVVAFRFERLTSFIAARGIQKEEGYEKHMSFLTLVKVVMKIDLLNGYKGHRTDLFNPLDL